jgi:hypothetical protein
MHSDKKNTLKNNHNHISKQALKQKKIVFGNYMFKYEKKKRWCFFLKKYKNKNTCFFLFFLF